MIVACKSEFGVSSYQEKSFVPILGCRLLFGQRVDLKSKIDFVNNETDFENVCGIIEKQANIGKQLRL